MQYILTAPLPLDWNIFARKVNQNTWTKRQIALQGHVRYVSNSLLYIFEHVSVVSHRTLKAYVSLLNAKYWLPLLSTNLKIYQRDLYDTESECNS